MLNEVSAKREGLSISLKHSHEIMEAIRGKKIDAAVLFLEAVRKKTARVPFRKYSSKGHLGGVPVGYPIKASGAIIKILNELKSNAKVVSGGDSDATIIRYDLGRGAYPRFSNGRVYKHGKRTNLTVFASINKVEKPKTEEKQTSEEKSKEETSNVTKEDNKQ